MRSAWSGVSCLRRIGWRRVTRSRLKIKAAPARAIELTKRAIDEGEETTLAEGIQAELRAIDENLASGDWQAGIARFNQNSPQE